MDKSKQNRKKAYTGLVEPSMYPVFYRRHAAAVTREALENCVQFTSVREFPVDRSINDTDTRFGDAGFFPPLRSGDRLTRLEEVIDMYVNHFGLGKVLWPVYPTLLADNFDELVDICVRDKLYLYDFWGFVPGSAPSGESIWGEYEIPESADKQMREKLGNRFLGYDNGEQDGRYIHAFAARVPVSSLCRREQYANFQAYFEKLNDSMQNYTVTLSSLTFLHYFAKEGNTIMLGAETAQGLPSSPMWFTFVRGAAKQYGLLFFGNASVWNRWGYKDYAVESAEPDTSQGFEMGKFAGTSLSLLRRLMYNQYMYNCDILGFENCWLNPKAAAQGEGNTETSYIIGDTRHELTPIGRIQQYCAAFIERHGSPGTMYTPLAIVADFFSGWVPPRHLYNDDIYKVWGNLPYDTADYQLHALFSMLFPGYENAGFYRDERGFCTPTPYGEIADLLLSDVQDAILQRYNTAIILENVELSLELYRKMACFVRNGGTLIIFAATVHKHKSLAEYDKDFLSFFGVSDLEPDGHGGYIAETQANAYENAYESAYEKAKGIVVSAQGEGYVKLLLNGLERSNDGCIKNSATVNASTMACPDSNANASTKASSDSNVNTTPNPYARLNDINADIPQPFKWREEIHDFFADEFEALAVLKVSNPLLHYCVNVYSADDSGSSYTLFVANNRHNAESFDILCPDGEITDVELLVIDDGVTNLPEFLPQTRDGGSRVCYDGAYVIQGGDCLIFRVETRCDPLEIIPDNAPKESDLPLFLALPKKTGIKEYMLVYPTFRHHFKGFLVPAAYFERISDEAAAKEAHYVKLQKTRIIVDFTAMLNHYPDLSLINNMPERTNESLNRISSILKKAALYGCEVAVFTSHRLCENHFTEEQGLEGLVRSYSIITEKCQSLGIRFVVQNRPNTIESQSGAITAAKSRGYEYAINTTFAQYDNYDYSADIKKAALLMLSMAAERDIFGQPYIINKTLRKSGDEVSAKAAFEHAVSSGVPIVLYSQYDNWDEVYADIEYLSSGIKYNPEWS